MVGELAEPLADPRGVHEQGLTDHDLGVAVEPGVEVLHVVDAQGHAALEAREAGDLAAQGHQVLVQVQADDRQAGVQPGQRQAQGAPAAPQIEQAAGAIGVQTQAAGERPEFGVGPEVGAGVEDAVVRQQGRGDVTQRGEAQKDQPAPRTRPWDFSPMCASWKVGPSGGAPLFTLSWRPMYW